jgi:eukaryotic-like serine/threonine-protein kinase
MSDDPITDNLEDPQFQAILASCYEALEQGRLLDREALLRRHPEYVQPLQAFLDDEPFLRQIAATLQASRESGHASAGDADATINADPRHFGVNAGETIRYIGEYEILGEIARGGMGIVFKAKQRNLRRLVALKMIRAGRLATPEDVERFRIEAQAAGRLNHPNIVAIHEVGEHEGHPYFTMDYVQGRSLAEAIRNDPMPVRQAAELVRLVAEATQFAHERGTVHRDLKPANILLDSNGVPKITDFGLAKMIAMPNDSSVLDLTKTGLIVGTPSYMAPEQASGTQNVAGPAVDIYSLGAVLYAALTGRPPLAADTPLETLLLVANQEPLAPRSLRPGIPRDLETICLKCLSKRPQARYATAQELADDLQRWLDSRPIRAKPTGPLQRAWKWSRRHPAWTAFFAVVLTASLIVTWLWRRAEHAYGMAAGELYVNRVSLAEREWHAQNTRRAIELLMDCAPTLQGWEWRLAAQLCLATPHVDLPVSPRLMVMAQFDPTGRLLATADGAVLSVWEARSLRLLHRIEGVSYRFCFSPDGKQIATGFENEVRVYSSFTGQNSGRLYAGDAKIYSVTFDSHGEHLALLDERFRVVLIRLADQAEVARFSVRDRGRPAWGIWLRFAPERPQIIVAAGDEAAEVWDPFLGQKIGQLAVSKPIGRPCALSNDGTRIAYNSSLITPVKDLVHVHDVRARRIYEFELQGKAFAAAFSPDGATLTIATEEVDPLSLLSPRTTSSLVQDLKIASLQSRGDRFTRTVIHLYDIETGKLRRKLRGHLGYVSFDSLAFHPDGKQIVSAGGFRRVPWEDDFVGEAKIWDLDDDSPSLVLRGHDAAVKHVAISSDGAKIASADEDGTVCLWNPRGQLERILSACVGAVRGIAFVDDDRRIAIADAEAIVWWNVETGGKVRSIAPRGVESRSNPITALRSGGRHDRLAYSTQRSVHVLDADTKEQIAVIPRAASGIAFRPDGAQIALTHLFRPHAELTTFDVATGSVRMQFEREVIGFGNRLGLFDVAFSPDGFRIAAVGANGLGLVWDTRTRRLSCELVGHHGTIWAVAYSPDGTRIATGGSDKTIKLWHATTGREMMTLRGHQRSIQDLAFSPCGKYLVSCGEDRTVRIWNAQLSLGIPLDEKR